LPSLLRAKYPVAYNVGLAKCGTTSFMHGLWSHPSVHAVRSHKEQRRFVWEMLKTREERYSVAAPRDVLDRWIEANTRMAFGAEGTPGRNPMPEPARALPTDGSKVGVDGTLVWSLPFELGHRLQATEPGVARVVAIGCDRAAQAYSWWRFTADVMFDASVHMERIKNNAAQPSPNRRRWRIAHCASHELAALWVGVQAPCRALVDILERQADGNGVAGGVAGGSQRP
jgi:hypothetical protein